MAWLEQACDGRGCSTALDWSCGARGRRWLAAAEHACCYQSNPAVQILFLLLLGACYTAFIRSIFPLLPSAGLPTWHM